MRKLALIAAASLVTAGAGLAVAQEAPNSTLATIIANGMSIDVQGMLIVFDFNEDGTFDSDFAGGTYTAEGNELCLDIPDFGVTTCSEYPDGKTSGESFTIDSDNGPLDITVG